MDSKLINFGLFVICLIGVVSCNKTIPDYVPPCDSDFCNCETETDQECCPSKDQLKNITSPDSGVCVSQDGSYYWQSSDNESEEDNSNVCVNLNDCCGQNRVAENVFVSCPEKCPFQRPPVGHILIACIKRTDPNNLYCNCAPGYVLDINGVCIPQEDCPQCGPNQWYVKCPTACPKTCLNRNETLLCPAICLPDGCICQTGYVRDMDGNCIPENECPVCGENEQYVTRPMPCPGTCKNPKGNPYCRMAQQKEGCACKEGYVRDDQGRCIDLNDCPCED